MSDVVIAAVFTAALALVGVLVGHRVRNREVVEAARVEVQRVEIEQQRADLDGLSKVVDSLRALVELQEKRLNAMGATLALVGDDLEHERNYNALLVGHIEARLPPPPPARPPRKAQT